MRILDKGGPARVAIAAAAVSAALIAAAGPVQAISGTEITDNSRSFTAKLTIGDGQRGCSGALIDSQWLLTAASCFVDDPNASLTVPAGKPKLHTTALIGRTDTSTTAGAVRDVVELVPRTDRDVVLARLSAPVPGVAPVALASSGASTAEDLTGTGFGRSKTVWAPVKLHVGTFTTGTPSGVDIPVTGKDGAAICMGDTGGPLLREANGKAQLVGLASKSFQGGCHGIDDAQTSTDGVGVRVDDLADWITTKIKRPSYTDFNCDATEDIAAGDPKATVGDKSAAGLVRIVYGGGKGVAEVNQNADFVPGEAEANDWFGSAMAVSDYNQDGCTDLIVGTPYEDLDGQVDAGMVTILYGAPDGLGKGPKATNLEQGKGTGAIAGAVTEADDRMGFSLAAGQTRTGASYAIIGAPGEDLDTRADVANAGNAFYLQGDKSIAVNQNNADLPGAAEDGDQFGYSVAGSGNHIAIGAPGEAVGSLANSGAIQVMSHSLNSNGLPTPVKAIHQDVEGISGSAEANDQFGFAVALTDYRPSGATGATDSILAVGSPGEALTVDAQGAPIEAAAADAAARADAGRVVTLRITAASGYSQLADVQQGKTNVTGTPEAGDRFGETVAVANSAPRDFGTTKSMLLAVGLPGEAEGTIIGSGAVQKFSLLGALGDNDRWIVPGNDAGLPGTPGKDQHLGSSIAATGTQLYLGMPNGPSAYGSVYAMPWSNITGGEVKAVTSYKPGTGGLPAAGKAFGTTIR